jgi:hypothetical protein
VVCVSVYRELLIRSSRVAAGDMCMYVCITIVVIITNCMLLHVLS